MTNNLRSKNLMTQKLSEAKITGVKTKQNNPLPTPLSSLCLLKGRSISVPQKQYFKNEELSSYTQD